MEQRMFDLLVMTQPATQSGAVGRALFAALLETRMRERIDAMRADLRERGLLVAPADPAELVWR